MAVLRERPYVQFNFLVDLGTGSTDGPEAGFQECSGIGMEVTVSEYRNGNEKENSVRKITGMNKSTDVTMKRGVIGSLNLYNWLHQIRNGDQSALRTVTVQLQNEDHTAVVQTWKLLRARIIKHTSGPMNAKGTDVAMEELVVAYERLEMEEAWQPAYSADCPASGPKRQQPRSTKSCRAWTSPRSWALQRQDRCICRLRWKASPRSRRSSE